MNLRICFQGLKSTKEAQIAYLEYKLLNLDKESEYFTPSDENNLKQAIFDLKLLSDEEFSIGYQTAWDEVFNDITESGEDFD